MPLPSLDYVSARGLTTGRLPGNVEVELNLIDHRPEARSATDAGGFDLVDGLSVARLHERFLVLLVELGIKPDEFAGWLPAPAPTGAHSSLESSVADICTHLDAAADVTPSSEGCEDCIPIGSRWVHLRVCMSCGHVGCCDSSPNRHATAHFHESSHPLIQSYEPGDEWWWCYVDEVAFAVDGGPNFSHP